MFIPSIPLDSILYQFQRRISVIKLDIEGFEYIALQGMKELIQIHKPVIFIEIWNNDPIEFMKTLGYTRYDDLGGLDRVFYPDK
jgi:hypothetical protein